MLVLGRPDQYAIVGVGLDVLLEILRTLERLSAEVALVWLQGNVNTNVRGDVVALDRCGAARVPLASQVEVVGALPPNVPLTNVVLFRVLAYQRDDYAHCRRSPSCNHPRVQQTQGKRP